MPSTLTLRQKRLRLLAEDPHCRYCGKTLDERTSTLDHIIPKSRGGGDNWSNLVLCCRRCNTRKGGMLPDEAFRWAKEVLSVARLACNGLSASGDR